MIVFLVLVIAVAGVVLTVALPPEDRYLGVCGIVMLATLLALSQIK